MIKRIITSLFQPLARWYLSKDRTYRYKDLKLMIKAGVFHPGLFFSTNILVKLIEKTDLKNKTVLELGAGSGLISFVAAKKGGIVTASDINPNVIENLQFNSIETGLKIGIIESDLFAHIPVNQHFDYIFINPPFYPKTPRNEAEMAWYCGEGFEYFISLFQQLASRDFGKTWMILSEDCEIKTIEKLAMENGIKMNQILQEKVLWEWNYVFELKLSAF